MQNRWNFLKTGFYEGITLYDILTILFTQTRSALRKAKPALTRSRPDDETLDRYFEYAKEFIALLRTHFPELDEFFTADNAPVIVQRYRGPEEGNALYRPIGLEVFAQIIARVTKETSLGEAVAIASRLPRRLNEPPYTGLIWQPRNGASTGRIITRNKVTVREILSYMIGRNGPSYSPARLVELYRRETGDAEVELPTRLV